MADHMQKARAFLEVAPRFRLGELPTEQTNPLSWNLSDLARNDLRGALEVLKEIDTRALSVLRKHLPAVQALAARIGRTLERGHRVFIGGCGATGRLALALETVWREEHDSDGLENRVVGFMAGGDAALVRSIEHFEDYPDYGERMLRELGFKDGDLMIGVTEGGETPFVIGAVASASHSSSNRPFFAYCNPDDILCRIAQRSREIIGNPDVEKINLTVGPMALAGSTRMQATTVLMAAVGYALLLHDAPAGAIGNAVDDLVGSWERLDTAFLAPFVENEAACYAKGEYMLYESGMHLGITILTDTTERSPTFSLRPFENSLDRDDGRSLCWFFLPDAADSLSAWKIILRRGPRALEWPELRGAASMNRLLGFDFGASGLKRRLGGTTHRRFRIAAEDRGLRFTLGDISAGVGLPEGPRLLCHLIAKMLLNTHSTLVMGRLGRYERNLMSWVRPSNNKLVDRAIRHIDLLLQEKGISLPYEQLAVECFKTMETIGPEQSVVLETVRRTTGGIDCGCVMPRGIH
jgi:N-acetylmuramic acid 6-phosphate etherase